MFHFPVKCDSIPEIYYFQFEKFISQTEVTAYRKNITPCLKILFLNQKWSHTGNLVIQAEKFGLPTGSDTSQNKPNFLRSI